MLFFSTQSCLRWYTVHNNLFKEKLESVQFNASLTLKGSIRGTSRKKNYQKLRLESIRDERWCRKLSVFFKALKKKSPRSSCLDSSQKLYLTRNMHDIFHFNTNLNFLQNSFLSSTIVEWHSLDLVLENLRDFRFLKLIFLGSYDQLQTLFLMVITQWESVLLPVLVLA